MNQPLESKNYDDVLVVDSERRPKILVVDDIRANIIAIEHVLSDIDADLVSTTDPYEALTFTFKYDFALALIDVQMPKLDGYQAAEMMQSAEHSREIPIVFVTANSLDESNVIRGYDVGAVDYITKPINPFILRSKVKAFVDLYNNKIEMAELNKRLDAARIEAEGASKLKSELVARLSYALKTPMHSVIGLTDMGVINIDKWDKSKQVDNLQEINSNSRSLLMLINDIVDLSKLEAGLMEFSYENSNIIPVVNDVIKSLKPLMHEKSITVDVDFSDESIYMDLDTTRIGQVLLNILSNAIKSSPVNGVINVSIVDKNDPDDEFKTINISISDCGDGISDSLKGVVFNKFTQDSSSAGYLSGSGLGLAICNEIVHAHDGTIWADNNSAGGAIFSFEIPVARVSE